MSILLSIILHNYHIKKTLLIYICTESQLKNETKTMLCYHVRKVLTSLRHMCLTNTHTNIMLSPFFVKAQSNILNIGRSFVYCNMSLHNTASINRLGYTGHHPEATYVGNWYSMFKYNLLKMHRLFKMSLHTIYDCSSNHNDMQQVFVPWSDTNRRG